MTKMGIAHAGEKLTPFLLGVSVKEFEKRMKRLEQLGKVEKVESDLQEKENKTEKKLALSYSEGKELGEGEEAAAGGEEEKASGENAATKIGRAQRKRK
jgi:hypothetical protein